MTSTPSLVPDAIREVSSLIQSEVFKWPAANSVTPRVMELCQRLNLIAREIDAADLTIAHPSRGVVDGLPKLPKALLEVLGDLDDQSVAYNQALSLIYEYARAALQAAALPAVPDAEEASSLMREAAEVLSAVVDGRDALPSNWRWPLIDELHGAAAMIAAAPAQECDQ